MGTQNGHKSMTIGSDFEKDPSNDNNRSTNMEELDKDLYSPLIPHEKQKHKQKDKIPTNTGSEKNNILIEKCDRKSLLYKNINTYATIGWLAKWICILDFFGEFIIFFALLYSQYSSQTKADTDTSYWEYLSSKEINPYSYYKSVVDVLCLCLFRTLPSSYMFSKTIEIFTKRQLDLLTSFSEKEPLIDAVGYTKNNDNDVPMTMIQIDESTLPYYERKNKTIRNSNLIKEYNVLFAEMSKVYYKFHHLLNFTLFKTILSTMAVTAKTGNFLAYDITANKYVLYVAFILGWTEVCLTIILKCKSAAYFILKPFKGQKKDQVEGTVTKEIEEREEEEQCLVQSTDLEGNKMHSSQGQEYALLQDQESNIYVEQYQYYFLITEKAFKKIKSSSTVTPKGISINVDGESEILLDEEGKEQTTKKEERRKVSIGEILALARPERGLIIIGTIALILSTASTMLLPTQLGNLVDSFSEISSDGTEKETAKQTLNRNTLILLLITLVGAIFTFIRGTLFNMAGERLVARIRRKLFHHIIEQDVSFFDNAKTGELMNRLSSDTTVLQNAATTNISMFLRYSLQIIISVVLLFYTSPKLTGVMLSVIPALILSASFYGKKAKKYGKEYQEALARGAEVAQESLSNLRTIRSFGAEDMENNNYAEKINLAYTFGFYKALSYGIFSGGVSALMYCAMILVLWYGANLVIDGSLSSGKLTAFLLYTVNIALSLAVLSNLFSDFMNAIGASERIFKIFDTQPKIPLKVGVLVETPPSIKESGTLINENVVPLISKESGEETKKTNHKDTTGTSSARSEYDNLEGGNMRNKIHLTGCIKYQHVSFAYPTREDVNVINSLDLTLDAHRSCAIVGTSGGGKSTLLSLLQRFYDVNDGGIMFEYISSERNDDISHNTEVETQEKKFVDLREIHLKSLRSQIAVVSQEPVLFSCSIFDNICYGKKALGLEISREEVIHAAKMANAHDFITNFPEGYDTLVGERGVRLSGGQKQRVAIARAILNNPTILLLDEATSALDAESEHLVKSALDRVMKGRTTIIIAHRLSTVQSADKIIVLDEGQIVGSGSHSSLLTNSPTYQKLVQYQLSVSK